MSCGIEGLVLALKLQTDILAEMVPTGWAIDGVSSIQSYYRKRELLWELQGVTRMCEKPVIQGVRPYFVRLGNTGARHEMLPEVKYYRPIPICGWMELQNCEEAK